MRSTVWNKEWLDETFMFSALYSLGWGVRVCVCVCVCVCTGYALTLGESDLMVEEEIHGASGRCYCCLLIKQFIQLYIQMFTFENTSLYNWIGIKVMFKPRVFLVPFFFVSLVNGSHFSQGGIKVVEYILATYSLSRQPNSDQRCLSRALHMTRQQKATRNTQHIRQTH
jgi:hypothetical protein